MEGSVGVVSARILAALRREQFLSLWELNQAINLKLPEFNRRPFQKKDGSRAPAFKEERPFLLPLPEHPYEMAVRKAAAVQHNYHISADGGNYSTPYEYIKQKVNVRLTKRLVEVFFSGNRIASHPRLYGRPGQYSTYEEHMPQEHRQYAAWNGERFLPWAHKIGEHTKTVVQLFLSRGQVEQQGYKSCMALLKLSGTYSALRPEQACERAPGFTERPSLKSIHTILKSGQDKLRPVENNAEVPQASSHGFTRGKEYYRQKREEK